MNKYFINIFADTNGDPVSEGPHLNFEMALEYISSETRYQYTLVVENGVARRVDYTDMAREYMAEQAEELAWEDREVKRGMYA